MTIGGPLCVASNLCLKLSILSLSVLGLSMPFKLSRLSNSALALRMDSGQRAYLYIDKLTRILSLKDEYWGVKDSLLKLFRKRPFYKQR
jgi:hypothetical protein